MQAMLRTPGDRLERFARPALACHQRRADVRAMPITPGRLGHDAPQMCVACLADGLLTCGVCGSKVIVTGGEGRRHYVCGSYHGGGSHACTNKLTVRRETAEELLVEPVLALLAQPVVNATVTEFRSKLRAQRRPAVRRTSSELVRANTRLADLEKFVATGAMSAAEAAPAIERARAARVEAERAASGSTVVDIDAAAEEFRGWAGKLRRALAGAALRLGKLCERSVAR
jgi:hypothetical protein